MKSLEGWTIVFDLDGTLVESAPDLLAALNHVLAIDNLPPVRLDQIRDMIGHGAKAMIRKGWEKSGSGISDDMLSARFDEFLNFYSNNIAVHSHPFEGAIDALDDLQREGARLAVCTNKTQALSERLLNALHLSTYFEAIVGADAVPEKKPDGRHILNTIERANGDPRKAVMIGDSRTDERAAADAQLPFIFVPFGYESEPKKVECDYVLERYEALPRILGLLAADQAASDL